MNVEQDIADFESELFEVCERHSEDLSHATLVGVLDVVKHIYMDAQLADKEAEAEAEIGGCGSSPLPRLLRRKK